MNFLFVDFETRSEAELRGKLSVGLYNYFNHKSTKALMLGYAFNKEDVELWEIDDPMDPMPERLKKALEDPLVKIIAFNSAFERYAFKYLLGIDISIERFIDPQVSARYLSLPGDLETVGEILGLPVDQAKDKEGARLIELFSKPHMTRKKKGVESVKFFNDKTSHPEDWKKFCDYCRQDVVSEREILRRERLLEAYPLPENEHKFWVMDQKINDRGIPVDVDFVKKAFKLAEAEKDEALKSQDKLTGLQNANSRNQLLVWAQNQGFKGNTLRKEAVESQLKYNTELTDLCRQVLEARKAASSTSYQKLATVLRQVCPDGRLRNQFVFLGSSRCGRWSSSGGVQLHNMARPAKQFDDKEVLDRARHLVRMEDYQGIKKEFGSVLLTVKSLIRTMFSVGSVKTFVVSDLAAIEVRVGAWVSKCQPMLDVFDAVKYPPKGRDPYVAFGVNLTQTPYERLEEALNSKDPKIKSEVKALRQMWKVGVLQCIYRAGGGDWGKNKYGDVIKTGLWGSLENMGILVEKDKSHEIVSVFRNSYEEICQMWYDLEGSILDVLRAPGDRIERALGPDDCVVIDKINIQGRNPLLRIKLPSGRRLHYLDAHIESTLMPWKDKEGKDVYKDALWYAGQNQVTKQWEEVTSHGGKTFENIVQGIARDVLAEDLYACTQIGLEVDAHAHDEIIAESDDNPFSPGLEDISTIMCRSIAWAPNLPLASEGFENNYYRKG